MGVNLIKGKNVKISDVARLYGNIEIGDNVRIDDFCILTGNIKIGSNIHIGCYSFCPVVKESSLRIMQGALHELPF